MGQQIATWLLAVTVATAFMADQPWAARPAAADDSIDRPLVVAFQVDDSDRGGRRVSRAVGTDGDLVVRDFPVADLISGPPDGGPAFGDASELIRLLRKATGQRHWRGRGQIQWLERRKLLHVENRATVVEDIERVLAKLRNTGPSRLEVTVRLLVVPPDCDERPRDGTAQVVSSAKVKRLLKRWKSYDTTDRNHVAQYSLADRDVVYAWTSRDESRESSMRGLNAVVQPSRDGREVLLTPYPFEGDASHVDWPVLSVGVGQSAMFDLPRSAAAPHDTDRVFAIVTVDAVSPTEASGRN
jgi:hypothetical protein